ncbi:putative 28S rRNA (cytosine-C(5))-methyltransferase [Blyttiomyces sp. JEL0837]|nr:putative 28S rRNA (cytosine-C(5))-methyltransferase [Blyttiomyces sp. JEL0837]
MSFYMRAADVLNKLDQRKGTIKSLILSSKIPDGDKKRMFALVCEALKYKEVIQEVIKASHFNKVKAKMPPNLSLVLVYDLLFGRGVGAAGKYKEVIQKQKTRLHAELVKIKIRRKAKTNTDLLPDHVRNAITLPRYVRVNALLSSTDEVIKKLCSEGYTLVDEYDASKPKTICKDKHIPNLLLLPPSTDLHDHELLTRGKIILQDKASCFPAFILNPPLNSVVIDACAAPGNKTSHLSAILQNSGTIYAFDQDKRRLQTLERLTGRAGCKNIKPRNVNFLEMNPTGPEFSKVQYILLDPSCSGSGIVRRMDHLLSHPDEIEEQEEEKATRVQALADFQVSVLLHAFKFPSVQRVVYSTCSVNQEENEDVVKRVLKAQKMFKLATNVFPGWKRRGWDVVEGAENLIRTDPATDQVIGFFVALFERAK